MNALRWVFALAVAFCLGLAATHARGESVAASAAVSEQSPGQVAHDFYAWYLGQLAKDQDPLTLEAPQLKDYVSPALLAEIDRRMKSADGMDADYFIKAQDYLDGWRANVAVAPAKVTGPSATALVTLGGTKDEIQKLRVTLALGADRRWKIRSVAKA